jgi:uncharacterized protein
MRVFERPGPINTDEVIQVVKTASSQYEHLVVASITGDSALRVAETIRDKQIIGLLNYSPSRAFHKCQMSALSI